ncbi:hypothetical protein ACFL4G_04295 [Thermodesulfobacteriota bacterium]
MLDSLTANDLPSIASVVVGLIGVLLAVVFYIKGRRMKRARYSTVGRTLIETSTPTVDGLTLLYNDRALERVTVTKVAVWSAGTETLRQSDIASQAELAVQFKEGAEILSASVLYVSEVANKVWLKDKPVECVSGWEVPFGFEFLEPRQGAVLQFVHTGSWSHGVTVAGKIIGSRDWEDQPSFHYRMAQMKERARGRYDDPVRYAKQSTIIAGFMIVLGLGTIVVPYLGIVIAAIGLVGAVTMFGNIRSGVPRDLSDHMGG